MLHHQRTDSATEKFASGFIDPHRLVLLPETDPYCSFDFEQEVHKAEVTLCVCGHCVNMRVRVAYAHARPVSVVEWSACI